MGTYLQDELDRRNHQASPTSTNEEPYVGYTRRSPGAGGVILSIILIVTAALGGWFLKGWFAQDEIETANEAARINTWESYNSGFGDGLRAAEEAKIPEPDSSLNNQPSQNEGTNAFPSEQYVFCGAGSDLNTGEPVIVLGTTVYWLDTSNSTDELVVGNAYLFQVDTFTQEVVGFTATPLVTSPNDTLCQNG